MSIKGVIETSCPKGCEPFDAEFWSFIHGGKSPELRELVAARECNLVVCPGCQGVFFVPAPYIYFEPAEDILAFVFPESFRAEEARWREKMHADFLELRKVLGDKMPLDMEPELYFGIDGIADLLNAETYRAEEREVMEAVAAELGLPIYRVHPGFSRRRGIPASLPFAPANGEGVTRANLIAGLEKLLAANDRLTAYADCLAALRAAADSPLPPSRAR